MLKIGITGQNGFIGKYLYNSFRLHPTKFVSVDFERSFFDNETKLDEFVSQCDVIIHLAAINRAEDEEFLYNTNIRLGEALVASLKRTNSQAHVIVSSSSQESVDNLYGTSKKVVRECFVTWAKECGGKVTGLIIPNVFGAFGRPFYNSFIATFCYQLTHGEVPEITRDAEVNLIYIQELVDTIYEVILKQEDNSKFIVEATTTIKVSEVLRLLVKYKSEYFFNGEIPALGTGFEFNLFNTFRSFIDHSSFFPKKLTQHTDNRGSFIEIARLGIGGQVSFSSTVKGITRGNHFHTRKIERFSVIRGEALIQMRRVDCDEVLEFYVDGKEPSYVDMPIWYTHNIKNIGEEELLTMFWINEPYDPNNADTFFEEV